MRSIAGTGRWLWAAALVILLTGGCAAPRARPLHVGSARVEVLTKLHPGYRELAAFDEWARSAAQATRQEPPVIPAPTSHTFLPMRGTPLAPPQIEAALGRAKQVTDEELARLTTELEARARKEIARRTRHAEQAARIEDAPRRGAILAEVETKRRQVLLASRTEVLNLRLRVENLEREVQQPQVLPTLRTQAQQQLQESRRKLAAALEQQSTRLSDLQKTYDAQLAALDRAAAERVARTVAERRQQLVRERDAAVARERERLAVPLETAAEKVALGLELPPAQPVTVSPGAFGLDVARESAAASRRSGEWSREISRSARQLSQRRQELTDAIEQDTRATVEMLASRHGWRVVWQKQRRAVDITPSAEKWLRAYWGS
jgi:hypothetical protein